MVGLWLAACGGSDRPSDDEWREIWDERRMLIPDADTIVSGGAAVCDDLIGKLRVELADLRPTPNPTLDGPVDDWIALAETVAFECPDRLDEATNRLRELDLIAAEIDAGLDADGG